MANSEERCPCMHREELEQLKQKHKNQLEDFDSRIQEEHDRAINNQMVLNDVYSRVKSIEAIHKEFGDFKKFLKDVDELLAILKNMRGFFVVLGWIGKIAKWLSAMVLAGSLFVAAFKRILE